MSEKENSNDNGSNSNEGTQESKPTAPVLETKPKPEGPPNVTVRTYAEVIVNRKDSDKE